jgi:4-aminobutyrate--pyruvate transaminase
MFMHGFTYSGHPVACAVGLRNVQIIEDENLPANAGAMGEYLLGELKRLVGDHPNVGNVRGKGLMLFVEPVTDKGTKAKFDPAKDIGGKLQAATRKRGLIVRCTNDGIAMAPPLIVSKEQCDTIATAVAESVAEVLG